jgi:hypothetical protein
MTRAPPPAWHEECRALRRQGLSFAALAARFQKNADTVRWVCDENGDRARAAARAAACRAGDGKRAAPKAPTRDESRSEAIMAAARAFAAGEIDRATLMARISGGRA